MNRRAFLQSTTGLLTLAAARSRAVDTPAALATTPRRPLKAAIIGDTNHGRYGHGLDLIFNGRPSIALVAIAEPLEAARHKKQQLLGAPRGYADYREMLERERPDLVSVATRWTDQHDPMIEAALAVGAHVYCEKPFVPSLAEADALLAQAHRAGRKLAVAHTQRLAPTMRLLKRRIDAGLLGELRAVRMNGKQDFRSGGEDLVVMGSHLFDLLRLFAGDPISVSARIRSQGHAITAADVRDGVYDHVGPVAGDDVEAQLILPHGVTAHYTSRKDHNDTPAGPYSIELSGSRGVARIACNFTPQITVQEGARWRRLESDTTPPPEAKESAEENLRLRDAAQALAVDDWLDAIAGNREPVCSGFNAMKSLEVIQGIFAAGLSGQTIELPPKNRRHALAPA